MSTENCAIPTGYNFEVIYRNFMANIRERTELEVSGATECDGSYVFENFDDAKYGVGESYNTFALDGKDGALRGR